MQHQCADCAYAVLPVRGLSDDGLWCTIAEMVLLSDCGFVTAEGECELCQVPGVPLDQDAGAHLQDLGQHARRGEMPQQSSVLTPTPPVPSSGQPPIQVLTTIVAAPSCMSRL